MIVFDLKCAQGHTFEAWFPDSKKYERQRKKQLIICPSCGDTTIDKALMAPNIATSDKSADTAPTPAQMVQMMRALSEVRTKVEENCEYVGEAFAEEARKIHYGETAKRDIYGEATKIDAEELHEEGVEFGIVPWVPRMDN